MAAAAGWADSGLGIAEVIAQKKAPGAGRRGQDITVME
jgi:hypothetical protein